MSFNGSSLVSLGPVGFGTAVINSPFGGSVQGGPFGLAVSQGGPIPITRDNIHSKLGAISPFAQPFGALHPFTPDSFGVTNPFSPTQVTPWDPFNPLPFGSFGPVPSAFNPVPGATNPNRSQFNSLVSGMPLGNLLNQTFGNGSAMNMIPTNIGTGQQMMSQMQSLNGFLGAGGGSRLMGQFQQARPLQQQFSQQQFVPQQQFAQQQFIPQQQQFAPRQQFAQQQFVPQQQFAQQQFIPQQQQFIPQQQFAQQQFVPQQQQFGSFNQSFQGGQGSFPGSQGQFMGGIGPVNPFAQQFNQMQNTQGTGSRMVTPYGVFTANIGALGGNANAGYLGSQAAGDAFAMVQSPINPGIIVSYANPYYKNYNFNQGYFMI